MEPPPNNKLPPDRARHTSLATEPSSSTMTAVAVSLPSSNNQLVLYSDRPASSFSSISSAASTVSMPSHTASSGSSVSAPIEKLSRPMAFDKVTNPFSAHSACYVFSRESGNSLCPINEPSHTRVGSCVTLLPLIRIHHNKIIITVRGTTSYEPS